MELKNERLSLTFRAPESHETQRFDRTAAVSQVVLDGKFSFCTPEQVLPTRRTTFGQGLTGEFVLEGAAEAAAAGEWFLKPGVGLCRQIEDHAPFDMWRAYEVRPFPVAVEPLENGLRFIQKSIPGKYALDVEKTFTLLENQVRLTITAANTGEMPLNLQEYQHNFLSLNGRPVGPGYRLEIPCDNRLSDLLHQTLRQGDEIELPSALAVEGKTAIWTDHLEGKVLYHRSGDIGPETPARWRMWDSSCCIQGVTDFLPSRVDLWAVEHCVCPEFYHSLSLAPGERRSWQRRWIFGENTENS